MRPTDRSSSERRHGRAARTPRVHREKTVKLHSRKKLLLSKETLRNLGVKTAIKAGAVPSNLATGC
jgi:hypothetical protein